MAAAGGDARPVPCQRRVPPAPAAAWSRQGSVSRLATQVLTQDEKQPRETPPGHSPCSVPAWPRLLLLRKVRSGEKKKKIKNKKEGGEKAAHLLPQEPHRLQKHSAAEWRGGGTGKVCGCAGRRRRRGDAGGADGAPTPRDGAYAAGRGGGRKGFPPSGAGPRRSSPRRGCRGSPRSSGRPAAAERAHPERSPAGPALAAGPGPPRPRGCAGRPCRRDGGGDTYSCAGCSQSVTNFGDGEQLLRVLI